jgi:hypothetical protein
MFNHKVPFQVNAGSRKVATEGILIETKGLAVSRAQQQGNAADLNLD